MNPSSQWQENNAQRLAAALAALRVRLERAGAPPPPASKAPLSPAPKAPPPATVELAPKTAAIEAPPSGTISRALFQRLLGPSAPSGKSTPAAIPAASPAPSDPAVPAEVAAAPEPASPQTSTLPAQIPWALDVLGERLGLSPFEQNVLLLCAALELDTRIAGLCARAQGDPGKPFPTFALALTLFDDGAWDAISPERPLRFWRLIEIHQPAVQALTASALRADERIVSYLKGLNFLDDRLSPFFSPLELASESAALGREQEQQAEQILRGWRQASPRGPLPVVQLVGPDPLSKQLVTYQVASQLNRRLYRLNAENLPAVPAELETLARLWQRESRLLPLALYFDAEELGGAELERSGSLSRFLSRSDGIFFVGGAGIHPAARARPPGLRYRQTRRHRTAIRLGRGAGARRRGLSRATGRPVQSQFAEH